MTTETVEIPAGSTLLKADLSAPHDAKAVVLFAHGTGSSRLSPRNQYVAGVLQQAGIATLLMDLLTPEEERIDQWNAELRFAITFLAGRLVAATDWLAQHPGLAGAPMGYFGASTGAAAALVASAVQPGVVSAIVSRGGRPELAGSALARTKAPTLLIVGGEDTPVIAYNQEALQQLQCEKRLDIVPGATHLFSEPGTLEEVARLATVWFIRHLVEARREAA